MILQYFVTASDTGNKIPVEIDKSTADDLVATKKTGRRTGQVSSSATLHLKSTLPKPKVAKLLHWVLTVKRNPVCLFISNTLKATRKATPP